MADIAGLSTLGVKLYYALESTAGTRPTTGYKQLTRINSIGEVNPDRETIDASALEDDHTREIPGRTGSPGNLPVVVTRTNATITEWTTLMTEYAARADVDARMWFQIVNPDMTDADFVKAAPPTKIPVPARDQNGLETVTMNLTVDDWELATKAVPADSSSGL